MIRYCPSLNLYPELAPLQSADLPLAPSSEREFVPAAYVQSSAICKLGLQITLTIEALLADKGYDADTIRIVLAAAKVETVILAKSNRGF